MIKLSADESMLLHIASDTVEIDYSLIKKTDFIKSCMREN